MQQEVLDRSSAKCNSCLFVSKGAKLTEDALFRARLTKVYAKSVSTDLFVLRAPVKLASVITPMLTSMLIFMFISTLISMLT